MIFIYNSFCTGYWVLNIIVQFLLARSSFIKNGNAAAVNQDQNYQSVCQLGPCVIHKAYQPDEKITNCHLQYRSIIYHSEIWRILWWQIIYQVYIHKIWLEGIYWLLNSYLTIGICYIEFPIISLLLAFCLFLYNQLL